MGERQFGPYRLVQQIAVGGMAEIHLAKTKGIAGFEKYVALKMIHPNFSQDQQFIQMLIDEAKITVQLQHVNIAQTFDLGRVGDTYYITMEYVDGADLYKLLRKGAEQDRMMPVDAAAYICKEVANGLDYAHRKRDVTGTPLGIVHRDVSPQNVLISHAGEVKLVDFGIAKATMRVRHTAVGVIKGKYYYMSPEQAWAEQVDRRSDLFSAGIILYEMLTGQMLYLEEDLQKLLHMVRKADIAPPTTLRRDIPPQLEHIVMHALEKRPDDRYQNAADLATDLERFLHAYSPVFTGAKISAYLRAVLNEEPPPQAPTEEAEDLSEPGRATQRITREELIQARSEFDDENSIIFRAHDLVRARSQTKRDGDDLDTETEELPDARRRGPRAAPQRAGAPRRADMYTMQLGETPDGGDGGGGDGDGDGDEGDKTIISGPPGFGGPDMGADGPDELPPISQRGHRDLPPEGDDATRVEAGGPEQRSDFDTMATAPSKLSPVLAASNPSPALSEIRRPRLSRRTPVGGVAVNAPAAAPRRPRPGTERVFPLAPPTTPTAAPWEAPPLVSSLDATARLAQLDVDELPPQFKLRRNAERTRRIIFIAASAVFVTSAIILTLALVHRSPAPAPRALRIVSIPGGARVTVNGQPLDARTPTTYAGARPGKSYDIQVDLSGYLPWRKTITVAADSGDVNKIIADLVRPGVTLRVSTTPPGAEVLLNGKSFGRTPLLREDLDRASAKILTVKLRGYRTVSRPLDWNHSTKKDISIDLKP